MVNYTIIIPHHNIPNLLRRCLHSIPLRDDTQIIVVDDCSDEVYKSDLSSLEKDYSHVDFYYSEICKGGGAARNIGLKHAIGKYILFADADDFYNYCIYDILDDYINEDSDVVFFNANSLDSDTYLHRNRIWHLNVMHEKYKTSPDKAITSFRYLYGEPSSKLIKRELIEKNNIFFDETRIHNDTKFSYMVGYFANKIKVDYRALYCLTDRSESVSKNLSHQAQLIRTKVFSEKNRFLIDHKIPVFDEILTWPFSNYLMQFDFRKFHDCLLISYKYHFSLIYIIKKIILTKIQHLIRFVK